MQVHIYAQLLHSVKKSEIFGTTILKKIILTNDNFHKTGFRVRYQDDKDKIHEERNN